MDFAKSPIDRLILGVHDVFDHARPGTGRRVVRLQGRGRPALFDILEDDGGIENRRAVFGHKGRDFRARIDFQKGGDAARADCIRCQALEVDFLFAQRHFVFLRIWR